MSRGFVKEDDQEEIPMVPQRAFLPEGITNFVTPYGMEQLLAEKQILIREREALDMTNENEKRIASNFINAKLHLLSSRIASARVVNPAEQPGNEVRFSAKVTLKAENSGEIQVFQIVGVDEADIAKGKISFLSPMTRLLINKKIGDTIIVKQAGNETVYKIVGIDY